MISFPWQESAGSWTYTAEDVCACVWTDRGAVWWDVSGPGGRWTKVSGAGFGTTADMQIADAKRCAQLWIDGYRRALREARP